jgi:hypothetical protein
MNFMSEKELLKALISYQYLTEVLNETEFYPDGI